MTFIDFTHYAFAVLLGVIWVDVYFCSQEE